MNLNAPLADHSAYEEYTGDIRARVPSPAMAQFASKVHRPKSIYARYAGVITVIVVHCVLGLLFLTANSTFTVTKERNVAVIELPPELPKPVEPPPPPKFQPPAVYVPAPIIPLITLEQPPPTPNAITLPPPAPAPTPPTAPIGPKAVPFEGDARSEYVARLLKHLNRYKRYPDSAKLRHEQGVVGLRFSIDRSGHVLAASITRTSSSKALDAEVLEAVRRADPLPAIPAIFGRDQLDLIVPVEFVLR